MKKLFFFLLICILSPELFSQNPQGFNYQAVARDATGSLIVNKSLPVRLTIQSDSLGGTVFWQELHSYATSNSLGIISLVLGKGSRQAGTASKFEDIDWSIPSIYLKTEINNNGWLLMGSSRLWSTPYSMVSSATRSLVAGSKLEIVSNNDATQEALFEVKRKDGQTVFAVYPDAVNVYVPDQQGKSAKGGFAVGGFGQEKGFSQHYFTVTPDSIRFYIDTLSKKGSGKGGFAVGGFGETKGGVKKFLSLSGLDIVDTITNASQLMWYPRKEAFLAGRIDILHPDSVGMNSFSTGYKNMAIGDYSHAMGYEAIARGNYSTAIGRKAVSWHNSFALGNFSEALGIDSYAIGSGSKAKGNTSIAIGVESISRGIGSISLGFKSEASEMYAVAIGYFAKATAFTAHSFGLEAEATALGSIALGMHAKAQADFSTSLGFYSRANNQYSTAIGYHAFASGPDSYAIGSYAEANGAKSFAIGSYGLNADGTVNESRATWTPGYCSLAFGMGAQATKVGSMSLGVNTTASADQSLAIGFGTTAAGNFATAMGYEATANGHKSIAIGAHYNTIFNKLVWEWSATLNRWVNTSVPTLIDRQTTATGEYSIAIGNGNQSNNGGMSLGTNNDATAFGSVSIGHSNSVTSDFSFAAGYGNIVEGIKSFALGENIIAKSANSFIVGAYNKIEGTTNEWNASDPLFAVGNGNPVIRSNAFAVLKDGNIVLSPNIEEGSGIQLCFDPVDNKLKKIASSTRYKTNILRLSDVSWIYNLNPVIFSYLNDDSNRLQYGLIAEDAESVNRNLVVYQNGEPEGINYNGLIAPIIKAVQEQKVLIDNLNNQNTRLLEENENLRIRLEEIENILSLLTEN